ncbi:hypothetical protein AB0D75_37195, partial [Streptomyces sp. NPDC048155]
GDDTARAAVDSVLPMHRAGTPEEIAEAVQFLAHPPGRRRPHGGRTPVPELVNREVGTGRVGLGGAVPA